MASTASSVALRQLRSAIRPRFASIPACSCSRLTSSAARGVHTSRQCKSAWPAGSAREEDDGSGPSSSHSQRSESVSSRPSKISVTSSSSSPSPSSTKGKARAIPFPPKSKTIAHLQANKEAGVPITCLTAYDLPTALSIRASDMDLCLIGDSLANVALGFGSTQLLTLDAMIHHCQAVQRGLSAALFSAAAAETLPVPLVIADMPFGSTFGSIDSAVSNVVRLVQETGIDGVKIEGSHEVLPLVRRLTDHGILVMGHIGLQPQRVGSTSGYRVQGKTAEQATGILQSAVALQEAGCFSIVLECIPTRLGEFISQRLRIPTIGIGAGSKTDGQILVMNDMLGDLTSAGHVIAGLAEHEDASPATSGPAPPVMCSDAPPPPKFVRNFAGPWSIGALRIAAVQAYVQAVRDRSFPDDDKEAYKINREEWRSFLDQHGTASPSS
ncbi:Phosphoenolpyruvate/pyruvate domain-containing protein [Testicularia cyperi]|uniref:3-methyl-2-oxobutanoate hydroxymethyltransferase n=1 Tax=Testicularia cyperi TaxID=1882483 RepID=A0A317XPF5_9BASI|nr:Phosphoenolpyruvate/pyruvate domain-containing protein [Testicularia cyperi]